MKKDAWAQIHKTTNGRESERKPILLRTLKKPITTVVYPTPTKNQEVAWLVWSGNRQSVPVIAIEIGSFNIWASKDRVFNKVLLETRTMASMSPVEVKYHITSITSKFLPKEPGELQSPTVLQLMTLSGESVDKTNLWYSIQTGENHTSRPWNLAAQVTSHLFPIMSQPF